MYTILLHEDKTLSANHKTNIYQRDNLADKIQFLFPKSCGDVDLTTCSALIRYIDQGNVPHEEPLKYDLELYKDHIRATFEVGVSNLTFWAGDIDIHLCFVKTNDDATDYIALQTGDITITILPRSSAFIPVQTSQSTLADLMIQLEAQRKQTQQAIEALSAGQEALQKEKADNFTYVDNMLQLTANGNPIGDIAEVVDEECECDPDNFEELDGYVVQPDEDNGNFEEL